MEFNRLFVENSYKEIYYEKAMHEKLNQIVHDKKAIEGDVWNIGNPQTGYLQRISNRGVYKNRYFPMFKVRSFFKTAPFPYGDERGPLRKEAYEILNENLKIIEHQSFSWLVLFSWEMEVAGCILCRRLF